MTMPRIPSLTGKGASPSISKQSVIDEFEDIILEYVEDSDVAEEVAQEIAGVLDKWGWADGD